MSKQALIQQDDRLFRAEDKNLTFDIVDAAGVAIDVSAFTMVYMLEELHDGATDILSKATGGAGITVGDPSSARVTIAVKKADTEDLEPRVYRQALWRTDSVSPQLLAEGSVMLRAAASLDAVLS